MGAKGGEEFRRKSSSVAGGEVGLDIARFAHTGDGGGYVLIGKDEAESKFGKSEAIAEEQFESVYALQGIAEIFVGEIVIAPIAGGPSA